LSSEEQLIPRCPHDLQMTVRVNQSRSEHVLMHPIIYLTGPDPRPHALVP
jgi:hypothetical protein